MTEIFKASVINEQMLTGSANLWEPISNSDVNREQFTDIITKKIIRDFLVKYFVCL